MPADTAPAQPVPGQRPTVDAHAREASADLLEKCTVPSLPNQYTSIVQAGTPPITVTPAHDADGNQTTLDNATGTWTLAWDAENRLVTATSETTKVECVYDYRSRRVEKRVSASADAGQTWIVSSTRRFLYDGWTLIAEFALDGETLALDRTHLWGVDLSGTLEGAGGIGGLLRTRLHQTAATTDYHPTYDANGNVSEYVDSTGTVVAHYEYGPFGGVTAATGTMAGSFAFRFSTKYLDSETALWYYGYRYYDATNGRWLCRDPIGEAGGVNLRAFLDNSRLGAVDPLGLYEVAITKGLEGVLDSPGTGLGPITVVVVSDYTVFRDAAKHFKTATTPTIVISGVKDNDDMMEALRREILARHLKVSEFHLSGHGWRGSGAQTKAGRLDEAWNLDLLLLSPRQKASFVSMFSENPLYVNWGCGAGKHTDNLEKVADMIGGWAKGWTGAVWAGPNPANWSFLELLTAWDVTMADLPQTLDEWRVVRSKREREVVMCPQS